MIQAERAQQTFVLPVVFESEGNYEVSVEEATATLEISKKEEPETEDQSETNQDSSDEANEETNTTKQSEEKEALIATEESNEESIPSKNKNSKRQSLKEIRQKSQQWLHLEKQLQILKSELSLFKRV
ncbi:hypothetical protein SNF32_17185 [Enterococcus mundtii]|nr:hypothetical protein [Enterococcus mundtii]